MSTDEDDVFSTNSISTDTDDENGENDVPEWAKSKEFDDNDDIRKKMIEEEEVEESPEAVLERKHAEEVHVLKEVNRKSVSRLKRRMELISQLRNAYLRDVVTLKHMINEKLSNDERVEVVETWKKTIPSVDIRQHLMLYGPKETSFDIIPCEACGGSVEIVHHDSSEIEELSRALSHMDKNKDDLRMIIATKGAQLDSIQDKMEKLEQSHKEEKLVLYKEMRNIKSSSEEVQKANTHYINQLKVLRERLSEAKVKAQQYDKVASNLNDTTALLNEANKQIKNMEDAFIKGKESVANMTEQLATCNEEKKNLEATVKKLEEHVKSVTNISSKHKQNSENLSKRVSQLEKMLAESQKQVESLNSKVQDLEISMEQQNEEMTGEIESLENMLDTAREEASTLNETMQDLRYDLSHATNEKDSLQTSYNELHFSKEEAVDKLEKQVAQLKERALKAENDLKSKLANYDKIESEMAKWKELGEKYEEEASQGAKLKKEFEKLKKDHDKLHEADKDRRRKLREAKKQEEEDEKKRLEEIAERKRHKSPKEGRKTKHIKEKDKARREETQKAFEEKSEEGIVQQKKYVPHKRQRGKCRSSPISTPSTGSYEPDGKAADRNMSLESSDFSEMPPLPDTTARTTTLAASGIEGKSQKVTSPLIVSSRSGSPVSTRDVFSSGGILELPTDSTGTPILSPVLNFLHDAPQQMKLFHLPEAEEEEQGSGKSDEAPNRSDSADLSLSVDASIKNFDFGTDKPISQRLRKACTKLVHEQVFAEEVGLTDEVNAVLIDVGKVSDGKEDELVLSSSEDEAKKEMSSDLDEFVTDNMRNIAMSNDTESLCSDINCEYRDMDTELNDETAKIFGSTIMEIYSELKMKMSVKDSRSTVDTLSPKLFELSAIAAKSQIGLWKAMRTTKNLTDTLCKMAAVCDKMVPYFSNDATTTALNDLTELYNKISDAEYFDQFKEKWITAAQVDEYMMKKLSEKQWNEQFSLFVDLQSNSHFDYGAEREYGFDSALNSMMMMEVFTEKMSGGVESILTSFFLDWLKVKINFVSGGGGEGGGFGGGGLVNEAELSRMQLEMNTVKADLDFLQFTHANVKKENEEMAEKIKLLEPEASRCADLVTRNTKLTNDLQALNMDFIKLTEEHTALTKSNKNLEAEHQKANNLIETQSSELSTTKSALTKVQEDLDYRNSIQDAMQQEVDYQRERERIRLYGLVSSEMQTDPFIVDVGCQTEFIVPPMSLQHKMSSSVSRATPASSKRSFYPVVTPGSSTRGLMANLNDEYSFPENHNSLSSRDLLLTDQVSATSNLSMSLDDGMNNSSIFDGTEFLEERSVLTPILMHHDSDFFSTSSKPGSKSSSTRGINERLKILNKLSAAHQKVDMGLPSIALSEVSSMGSQTTKIPQPLSGKLSPIKYEKPDTGPMWTRSDTIRIQPRKYLSRTESRNEIDNILEVHRRHQAPPYRKDAKSR